MTQTLKELLLAFICFAYVGVRGTARSEADGHEHLRIVIVQLAKLGDMVCTTPMFRAIKKKYPGAHVTVVGNKINKEVLEHSPDVDEYVVFDGIFSIARLLRAGRYDFGCTTGPSMAALAALFLGNVRTIIVPEIKEGISPLETISYRFVRVLVKKAPHRMGRYAPGEYLRLLKPLDIRSEDTKKHLQYSVPARKRAEEFFGALKQPVIGISPGAGNKIKQWPPERFAAVADYLVREKGATVILFGSIRDEREVVEMVAHCKEQVINARNLFSIDELKAVISKLNLFISVDTGPIYIAEVFGVATIDIVGPMDEREQPPVGPQHRVIVPAERKAPAVHIMDARPHDKMEARRQIESISVSQVIEVVKELLKVK